MQEISTFYRDREALVACPIFMKFDIRHGAYEVKSPT